MRNIIDDIFHSLGISIFTLTEKINSFFKSFSKKEMYLADPTYFIYLFISLLIAMQLQIIF